MGKNIVLSGYYGFKNFGDEAILSVLVQKLESYGHNITVISSNPEYTKSQHNNVNSIYTFNFKDIVSTIFHTDILVSGGGSLLQDATSLKSLFYYLGIIFLGIFFRKKVIIFAQGIGPITDIFGEIFTLILLKRCKYVSVRDSESFKYLKKHNINADLLCDPIFSTQISDNIQKEKVVAVQLRDCKGINTDFINRLSHEVCTHFPDYKIEIFSLQDEIDFNICKEFEKNIQMLNPDMNIVVYKDLSNSQIINQLSKAEYLIAMRFHALITGILTKTKVLAVNYDIKVEKIAAEFNLPIVNFHCELKDQFDNMKNENIEEIASKAQNKKFDWSGFENAINN